MTNDSVKTTDLMLYYVELGTEFTTAYGDIGAPFYDSMLSMYHKVVEACIKNESYYELFKDRLGHIVDMAGGIGWGYGDTLIELYQSLLGYYEEEEE